MKLEKKGSILIEDNSEVFLFLKSSPSLVYLEFKDRNRLLLEGGAFYPEIILAEGVVDYHPVHKDYYNLEVEPNSRILLKVNPIVYRGTINPEKVNLDHKELLENRDYLKNEYDIDKDHPLVKKTAEEILSTLEPERRDNPYFLSWRVFDWVHKNIKYAILPPEIIEHVSQVIEKLWKERGDSLNSYEILKSSFPSMEDEVLRKVAEPVYYLPEHAIKYEGKKPYEVAKELMKKVGEHFQYFWLSEMSASKTLERKAGKCVCITNTFVALLRALGIPSKEVGGYLYGYSIGRHSWALVYLPPYGWKEVDPTHGKFYDFPYEKYAYDFITEIENKASPPRIIAFNKEDKPNNSTLKEVINRVRRKKMLELLYQKHL